MKKRQLRYPVCPKCCYNLSDTPISEGGIYTCSECGVQVDNLTAHKPPSYIGNLGIPILVVSLPPLIVYLLGLLPVFIAQEISTRANLAAFFLLFSPITFLWILLVPFYYALRVSKWEGPNDWSSPTKTCFTILLLSLCYTVPVFLFFWILAFAIFAGSSF